MSADEVSFRRGSGGEELSGEGAGVAHQDDRVEPLGQAEEAAGVVAKVDHPDFWTSA